MTNQQLEYLYILKIMGYFFLVFIGLIILFLIGFIIFMKYHKEKIKKEFNLTEDEFQDRLQMENLKRRLK